MLLWSESEYFFNSIRFISSQKLNRQLIAGPKQQLLAVGKLLWSGPTEQGTERVHASNWLSTAFNTVVVDEENEASARLQQQQQLRKQADKQQ